MDSGTSSRVFWVVWLSIGFLFVTAASTVWYVYDWNLDRVDDLRAMCERNNVLREEVRDLRGPPVADSPRLAPVDCERAFP